jgi:hypothetical protein
LHTSNFPLTPPWLDPLSVDQALSALAKTKQGYGNEPVMRTIMPGRKTKNIELPLEPLAPPLPEGVSVHMGGAKVGMRSGAQKSASTRAKRRGGVSR